MDPDLNRLKVFYRVYLNGSVVGAARELNVSQSAVSQHLMKLEREIRVPLFIRLHKRLVPTAAGKKLFQVMKPFIRGLEGVVRDIRSEHEGLRGMLRIGAPVEFGETYLPPIFASFREEYPEVSYYVELGHPSVILPMLSDGELDFVFSDFFSERDASNQGMAAFDIRTIVNERLVLLCSREYYNRWIRGDHSLKRLEKIQYIAYRTNAPALRSWFRHHFGTTSVNPDIVLMVESVRTVISGVLSHLGAGIVPSHLVHSEIDQGKLVQITTRKPEMINRISLVQFLDKIPNKIEKVFLKHFMEAVKNTDIYQIGNK